jgi:uncharacterized protein (DUF58 family)
VTRHPAPLAVGGALLLAFVAAAAGSRALFAVALGLLVVCAGCWLVVRVAGRFLRVERRVTTHEVVEGRPVELAFAVRGTRGLPVHVEALGPAGRWLPLGPDGGRVSCVIDRPGAHLLQASLLRVRDDLGLFHRRVRAGTPEALLVLPEPAAPQHAPRRGGTDPVGDPEPDGLRAYVPGTPMSRIHWASAARTGELQERAFRTAREGLPLVVVETAGAPDEASVDWAARAAAGHVLALVRGGGCRLLLPGDRTPTVVVDAGGQWAAVHRRLAGLADADDDAGARRAAPDDPAALVVRASGAPDEARGPRGPLPPGVVRLAAGAAA